MASTCISFDKVWEAGKEEIENFIVQFNNGQILSENDLPQNIKLWPGKNNPFSEACKVMPDYDFAPFMDINQDGDYNPLDGDVPLIKGDQALWWIFNDSGNTHTNSNGKALGLEVHASAYALKTTDIDKDVLNYTTFYEYKIINKNQYDLTKMHIAKWIDTDLGAYDDDYIGCDTIRNMGITYNGTSEDAAYGKDPPLLGIKLVESPKDENGEDLGMTSFMRHDKDFTVIQGIPKEPEHFYNYMRGKWKNGQTITYGNDGSNPDGIPTTFLYPSNPQDPEGWSECSSFNEPANRDFVMGTGPFTLKAEKSTLYSYAVIYARFEDAYPCPDFELLGEQADIVQDYYDKELGMLTNINDKSIEKDNPIRIYPNPINALGDITIESTQIINHIKLFSINGTLIQQHYLASFITLKKDIVLSTKASSQGVYVLQIGLQNGDVWMEKVVFY